MFRGLLCIDSASETRVASRYETARSCIKLVSPTGKAGFYQDLLQNKCWGEKSLSYQYPEMEGISCYYQMSEYHWLAILF